MMSKFTGTKTGIKSNHTFMQIPQMFRWIFVMSFLLIGMLVSNNVKAQYSNVPVTGYNSDVVLNGNGTAFTSITPGTNLDAVSGGYYLAASDWTYSPTGCTPLTLFMPTTGTVNANATVASGLVYNLQSYSGLNDLRIPATSGNITGTGTLNVTTPVPAANLYLLCTAGGAAITSGITVTVTFDDNSTQVFSNLTVLDWFTNTNPAVGPLGRIQETITACGSTTGNTGPYLFDLALSIAPANWSKNISSIKVDKTITTGIMNVFAVGRKAPCVAPAEAALNLVQGATTTSSIAASFTAAPSAPSGYLVVGYPSGATPTPPAAGTTYTVNQILGAGKVIQSGATTSFSASGLTGGTTYDVYVYTFNTGATCGGPNYNTASVLSGPLTTSACTGLAGGTYPVGPTGVSLGGFASLTSALTTIGSGITGPVVLELQAAYLSTVETFPITFPNNPCIGAVNTLTIRPETGATNLSITSANATGTINFNIGNYITIDGRAGGSGISQLTIANINPGTSYAINFTGDASNNTIKYCTVTSRNTSASSGTIVFGGGTVTGNDNNTIDNCNIKDDGTGNPAIGIYSLGTSAAIDNSNNTISNNNISNFFSATLSTNGILLGNTGNSGWTITNNRLFQTATRTYTTANGQNGISVQTGSGYTITGNIIGFANASGTGTTNLLGLSTGALGGTFPSAYTVGGTSNALRYIGFNLNFTAGGTNSLVQSNTIGGFAIYTSNATTSGSGTWCAISLAGGNATIGGASAGLGNTIGATSGIGSVYIASTATGGTVVGITASSANTVTIQNNTIGSIDAVGTTSSLAGGFVGIDASGAGAFVINNNIIGNTTTDNIRTGYTVSGANLSNAGTLTSTTGGTGAIVVARAATTGTTLSINTNTVRGLVTSGTTTAFTGITSTGANTTSVSINGNALGTSALGLIRYAFANSGTLTGISLTGSTAATVHSIQTNDFQGIVYAAASSGSHSYITTTAGTAAGDVTTIAGNTFTNLNVNTSGAVIFITQTYNAAATGTKNTNNNSIVTAYQRGGASGSVDLVRDNGSSVTGAISNCQNNNFSNITIAGTSTINGLNFTDGGTAPTRTVTGNTLNNWTAITGAVSAMIFNYWNGVSSLSNNTITNITSQAAVTGISIGSSINTATSVAIASNTITNLTSTGTGGSVIGISCANTSTLININNNAINTLASTGASAVTGISVSGATATNVYKNTICNISGSNASSTVNGILISAGTTVTVYNNRIADLRTPAANAANPLIGLNITGGTTVRAYYNSIYLNGTSSGALFGSSAISVSTSPTVTLNNNIFYNASSTTGAGLAAAHRRSSTAITTYAAASNNNLFFGSTIYTDGTNTDATLPAYKSRVSTKDNVSVSENLTTTPTFLSVTCGNPNFLKISTSVATQLESAGTPIAGITDDFEGDTRNVSLPDIGADEFAGIVSDQTPPSITAVTLIGNACSLTSRNVTAFITDATGVDNTSAQPRVYYRKNGGSYVSVAGSLTTGTVNAGTWTFTIDYSLVSGAAPANTIDYFVVAQDQLGNATGSPVTGLVITNVNTVPTAPTTPLTYTVANTLSGTYTVGATGANYPTLTAAIADYNSGCLAGPVVFSLLDASYVEAAALTINANPQSSAINTLTIKPTQANTNISVTGGSSSAIFILNGADYVTLNGSIAATANTVCPVSAASRNLTITNSNAGTSSAVVWLQTTAGADAATNNNIINCNLVGSGVAQTLFGAGSGSASIGTSSLGTANNNNTFINNNISGTQYGVYSQGASAANKNTGTIINQNLFNASANAKGGIWVGFENGVIISGNNISNIAQVGVADVFGITCGFGTTMSATTTSGNDVTNATITKNTIGSVVNTSTLSAYGIGVSAATSGTTLISNNMVYGVSANGTAGDFAAGIVLGGGAGSTTNVYYNTVAMQGTIAGTSAATQTSACLAVTNSTAPTLDLRNNIFSNTQTGNAAATVRFAAIALAYSTFAILTSNNNDLYAAGAGPGSYTLGITGTVVGGTNSATLANWQTTTGKDAASVNVLPNYTSTTNLRLLTINNDAMDNTGAVVSVTDDIDCSVRSATPDMGINEFAKVPTVVINTVSASPSANQCVATARTITANITSGNFTVTSVTLNYSFNGTAQAPITMTGGNPAANQTSNWTAIIPAATPTNASVTWTVTAIDGAPVTRTATGTSYADDPLNGVAAVAAASPSTVCAGSPVTLTATLSKPLTATIGTATTATTLTEELTAFCNRRTTYQVQSIYLASELSAAGFGAGAITVLKYAINANGDAATNSNFIVKMGSTASTTLSAFVTSGLTSVFGPVTYTHAVGLNTITLSTPFVWDGTSNIIIEITHGGINSINNATTLYTDQGVNRTAYGFNGATSATLSTKRFNVVIDGTGAPATTGVSWSDGTNTVGSGTPLIVNPTVTTTYSATVTAAGCTKTTNSVTVTANPLPAAPGANNSIQCGTAIPAAFVTGAFGNFKWYSAQTGGTLLQTGGATFTGSISTTTHFWVSQNNGSCESLRTDVVASVNPPDPISASSNGPVCSGSTLSLTATVTSGTNGNNYTYSWTASPATGSGIPTSQAGGTGTFGSPASTTVTPTASGTYTYTVTGTDGGCVAVSTVTVVVKALPQINSTTATPSTICAGTNVTLNGTTGSQASGPVTVGAGATTISGTTTGTANPYNHYYGGQKTQIIYTKAELNALGMSAGNISALAYNLSSLGSATLTMANFTINIGHTTQSAATTTLITSGLTQVYANALQGVSVGSNAYTFSTPFNWNNTDNIVVSISWSNVNSGNSSASPVIVSDVASFTCASYIWADNATAASLFTASTSTGVGSLSTSGTTSNRPKIVFTAITGVNSTGSMNWSWNPGSLPGSTVIVNPTSTTTYTVTATDPATTCSNTATVTVTVNPLPPAPSANNGTDQCGTAVSDMNVSSNNITDPQAPPFFKWYDAATGGVLKQSGTSTIYNTPVSVTTTLYVSEVSLNGCEGPRSPVTTTVSDADLITASASPVIVCLGASTDIGVTYTPSFNSFATFTLTAAGGAESGVTGSISLSPNETGDGTAPYTITPTATGTYTYTVTAFDPDKNCTSVDTTVVTVGPLPVITSASASPSTICAGATVTLTAVGAPQYANVPVTGYNHDVVANGTGAVSASTTATFDNTQWTLAASDWNFSGSCTALSFFMPNSGTVNANSANAPAPGLTYILQPYTGNNDLRVPATGSGIGSGTLAVTTPVPMSKLYLLYGAGNGPITSGVTVTVTFTDASTQVFASQTAQDWFSTTTPAISNLGRVDRNVTPACVTTVTGGPQLFDMVLNISAPNQAKLVQSITVATTVAGSTMNVMAVGRLAPSSAFQTSHYNWAWNPGNFTDSVATVTPSTTTTYTVSATNTVTGCTATATTTVTVNPLPAAPSTNSPVTRCGPGSVTLTATGSGGTLNWYNVSTGGTSLQTGGSYTTNVTGSTSFWVAETSAAGCAGPRTQVTVTVTTPPTLAITPASTTTFCQGGAVSLNGASASDPSYVNFNWSTSPSVGSGLSSATGTSVTVTPTVAGVYTITLTANDGGSNGCANVATIVVTANANPVITSATATPSTTCSGGAVTLNGTSINALPGTAASGAVSGVTSTSTTIGAFYGLYYGNGRAQALYTAAELSAAGLTPGNITSLAVNVGSIGNGTALNGYTVKIATTAATSLSSYLTPSFTTVFGPVNYNPTVGINTITFASPFAWDGTSNILIEYCFSNQITGTSTTAVTNDYTVTGYNSFINYQVDGTTGAGACTTTTVTNTSTNRPNLIFGGQVGTVVTNTLNWIWNPGNLSGSSVLIHPTASTTYTVTATVPGTGCFTVYSPVSVTVTPVGANASATPNTPVCAGSSVTLNAGATGGAPFSYAWASTPLGTYTPDVNGNITVNPTVTTSYTVTVTDACGNPTTSSVTVTVNPLPTVSVSPTTASFCYPGGTAVTLNGSGATSYTWSPSAGLSSSTGASVSASPGITTAYTVTGTDVNGCVNTATATITVNPNVTSPAASATPATICAGSNIALTSSATLNGPISGYTLNSNSGVTFIDISGTGTSVGTVSDDSEHNISIPSFSFNGVVYTTARVGANGVIVFGSTSGEITFSNASLPSTANTAGNVFLAPWWDDLDVNLGGTIKTQTVGNNFVIEYIGMDHNLFTTGAVTFEVQLDLVTSAIHFVYQDAVFGSATYDGGASANVGIQMSSTSAVQYSNNTASLTNGQSITFTPTYTQLPINYAWSGPGGFTSIQQNPTAVATATGVYTVTMTAASGSGCSASATTSTVTVNPRPSGVISGSTSYCNGQSTSTNLSIAVTGAGPWSGTLLPGAIPFSGATNPISVSVTPSSTTTYTIATLNGSQCSSTAADLSGSATITVNPRPTGVISGGATYCNGANTATALSIAVTGVGPFSGTLSDGTAFSGISSPISVSVTPSATTTYTIATLNGSQCSAITADLSGSATVTVNPRPTGVISGGATYCNGANTATTLSIAVTGAGPWSGTLSPGAIPFSGTSSPITLSVSPSSTTTYTIATLNGSQCSSIAADLSGSATITINPRPAGVISGGATYCAGSVTPTTLSIAVSNAPGPWSGTLSDGTPFSGTTSPITVSVTPTSTTTYTIATLNGSQCSSISADLTGSATVTVNPLAATPTASVVQPTCALGTGTINVTSPLGAGNTYSLDGTTFQSSPSFPGKAPGTYTLYVHNSFGCFAPATINVTVNPQPFTPSAPTVTGTVNVCPFIAPTGGAPVTYHASAPGATSYTWTIPVSRVILVSGQGTADLTVRFDTGYVNVPNKQIRVTASSICGTSTTFTIFYTVAQTPITPGPITGPTDACPFIGQPTTATYTINKATSATGYLWTSPAGANAVHPNGAGTINDTTIVVTFTPGYVAGNITVVATNDCGASGARNIFVSRNAPSQPSLIAGPTNACEFSAPATTPATYTVPNVPGTTYTWTAPAGSTNPTGQGTNTFSFIYPNGFTSGTVSVTATSGCGTSAPRTLAISRLNPAIPSVIDVIQTHFCGEGLNSRVFTYSVSSMPANATSVQWTVPAVATLVSGQGTTTITVSYPDAAVSGVVTAQATSNCGVSTVRSTTVKLPACPPPGFAGNNNGGTNSTAEAKGAVKTTTTATPAESMEVKIFPNPTVSDFKLQVITPGKEEINVRVIDNEGRLFKTFKLMPYQTIALGAELKAGSYMVEVRQGRNVKTTKVIKF